MYEQGVWLGSRVTPYVCSDCLACDQYLTTLQLATEEVRIGGSRASACIRRGEQAPRTVYRALWGQTATQRERQPQQPELDCVPLLLPASNIFVLSHRRAPASLYFKSAINSAGRQRSQVQIIDQDPPDLTARQIRGWLYNAKWFL